MGRFGRDYNNSYEIEADQAKSMVWEEMTDIITVFMKRLCTRQ